jgi:hypothetical protein
MHQLSTNTNKNRKNFPLQIIIKGKYSHVQATQTHWQKENPLENFRRIFFKSTEYLSQLPMKQHSNTLILFDSYHKWEENFSLLLRLFVSSR